LRSAETEIVLDQFSEARQEVERQLLQSWQVVTTTFALLSDSQELRQVS
jgi:hypothetical protein